MKIYLIRHSESIDDIENCYGGIADFDLTENGRNTVKEYSKQFIDFGVEKIYTSPYKRAYQTAEILAENKKIEIEKVIDIRELNSYGILSGVNKDIAKEIFSSVFDMEEFKNIGYYLGKTFLGGEDINEFDIRVKNSMKYVIEKSKDLKVIAIITHGGVYRSIFKNILNENSKIGEIEDLGTTIIDYENDKFNIVKEIGIKFI